MTQVEIIKDIQDTIREFCSNPADYPLYTETCLLSCPASMALYYDQTIPQIEYLVARALLSI